MSERFDVRRHSSCQQRISWLVITYTASYVVAMDPSNVPQQRRLVTQIPGPMLGVRVAKTSRLGYYASLAYALTWVSWPAVPNGVDYSIPTKTAEHTLIAAQDNATRAARAAAERASALASLEAEIRRLTESVETAEENKAEAEGGLTELGDGSTKLGFELQVRLFAAGHRRDHGGQTGGHRSRCSRSATSTGSGRGSGGIRINCASTAATDRVVSASGWSR